MSQENKSVAATREPEDSVAAGLPPVVAGADLAGVAADAAPLGVGGQIRAARLAKKMSLADVSQVIKISPRVLEQVEGNAWGELSGRTFARGVVRSYAKLVQLDPEPLLKELESAPLPGPPTLDLPRSTDAALPVPGEAQRRDLVAMVGGVFLVALAIVAYYLIPDDWFSRQGKLIGAAEPVREVVSSVPSGTPGEPSVPVSSAQSEAVSATQPSPVAAIAHAQEEKAEAKPVSKSAQDAQGTLGASGSETGATSGLDQKAGKKTDRQLEQSADGKVEGKAAQVSTGTAAELSLSFDESSWVEVRDQNGLILLSDTIEAGVTRKISAAPPLALWFGNADGVRVQYRGVSVDLRPHTRQKVARLTLE